MSSMWGNLLTISIFGESHGPTIGVVIDGLPSGHHLDLDDIRAFMKRRAPGRTAWSTPRVEADEPQIVSGLFEGYTTGTPLTALIQNTDTRSGDYSELQIKPRPGHADLTGMVRYDGFNDPRGSGHFSGRLTAPLTFAGAVCRQILKQHKIQIVSHIKEIAGISDLPMDTVNPDVAAYAALADKPLPVISDTASEAMQAAVLDAKTNLDSVGGIIETMIVGVPAGIGNPIFDGIESRLGSLLFAIPAVKGVEFGDGFAVTKRKGSTNNDSPVFSSAGIRLMTNHGGGVDGGISNGMPISFRVGFKPTASIGREQQTINLKTKTAETLVIHGRHDPCIATRAVPVVEAVAAIATLDLLLEAEGRRPLAQRGQSN
ncbi:MAG: chorismate synthase [Eubacteriales bacterium]|nr:chorismate synthase [Eubacteriales bacterium]